MGYFRLVLSNFKKFIIIAWKREKSYFFWIVLNFMASGIFSYTLIKVPELVLELASSQFFDVQRFITAFGVLLISGVLASLSKIYFTPKGYRIRYYLLEKMMVQNITMPLEKYESPEVQDSAWTVMRSVSGIDGVQGFYLNLGMLMGAIAPIFVSAGILYLINPWLSWMILVWFIVYSVIVVNGTKKMNKMHREFNPKWREGWYLNDIAEDFANAKEIRVYNLSSWIGNKLDALALDIKQLAVKTSKYQYQALVLDDAYRFVRDLLMYGSLGAAYLKGQINLGSLAAYTVMLGQLNTALEQTLKHLIDVLNMHENFDSMFHYLEIDAEQEAGEDVDSSSWTIEFRNVNFKYPNTEHMIYENLNLTIRQGQKLAIVGLNGTGKSTLIKLLLRLYQPTSGEILFNGLNIQCLKLKDYYRLFAPVFQDISVFAFSLKENLVFESDVDDQEIRQCLSDVGLKNLADDLDAEMTHYVSEDGLSLSGGQSQKLAMARAVLSKRPVLVLDEPTSALDALAEYDYYTNINKLHSDKTILFVSHRLASTRFCDEIILVGEKTILEQGTHQELIAKRGVYFELFEVQAKYYREENAHA